MKLVKRVTAIVGLGVGLAFAGWGMSWERIAIAARYWPTVQGTVAQSRIVSRRGAHSDVSYDYEVAGVRYWGDRVSLDIFVDERDQQARYPAGSPVEVHYSPGDPYVSILEPGGHRGLVLIVSGLSVVWRAARTLLGRR